MIDLPWITRHAVDRYIERVERTASASLAHQRISNILLGGRCRSTPRHWMRGQAHITPGLRFVYWTGQPDVCLLVLDGAVVTVLTRRLSRRWRREAGVEPGSVAPPIYAVDASRARPQHAPMREAA